VSVVVAEPSWGVAFAAGVVSFLSPCVAPLAPGYLAYMAGASALGEGRTGRGMAARFLATSLLFMLGFTLIFVMLGTSVSFVASFLEEHRPTLYQVAGGAMIGMGLLISGLIRFPLFYRERRIHVSERALGPAAPVLLGMAFAVAWTPCISPILGSILFYAGATETGGRGGLLLFVYSLGFGLPFILAGLGFASALRFASWARRHYAVISAVSGVLVAAMGVFLLTDRWSYVTLWMQKMYYTAF